MKLLPILALALSLPLAAQMPEPTEHHHKLAQLVGTWDAHLEYMGMDGQMTKSKGVSVRKQPLGAFWVFDNFQAQMMGADFRGHGTTGYDPEKKKYVGSWVDSMTPSLMVTEGNFDKSGKVLTMSGMGPSPEGGKVMHKMVSTFVDKDTEKFEMFMAGPDGKDIKLMTITYKRRTSKLDKVKSDKAGG